MLQIAAIAKKKVLPGRPIGRPGRTFFLAIAAIWSNEFRVLQGDLVDKRPSPSIERCWEATQNEMPYDPVWEAMSGRYVRDESRSPLGQDTISERHLASTRGNDSVVGNL